MVDPTDQNRAQDAPVSTEITQLLAEISVTKNKIKTIRAQAADVLDQNEDHKTLKTASEELATKRAEARKTLLEDRDYEKLSAELEDYRFKLRDLNEILSAHLLEFYNKTQKTELVDRTGATHQVIISAKLGKVGGTSEGSTT